MSLVGNCHHDSMDDSGDVPKMGAKMLRRSATLASIQLPEAPPTAGRGLRRATTLTGQLSSISLSEPAAAEEEDRVVFKFEEDSASVYCWGGNSALLGRTGNAATPIPVSIPPAVAVKSVACGGFHSVVVSQQLELFSFGQGTEGQLGHGDFQDCAAPKLVQLLAGLSVRQAAVGLNHTAVSVESGGAGALWTWGLNLNKQLGRPTAPEFRHVVRCGVRLRQLPVGVALRQLWGPWYAEPRSERATTTRCGSRATRWAEWCWV